MPPIADSTGAREPIFADRGESLVSYARRLIRERQYRAAIQACRSGLQSGQTSAELHEVVGRALLLSGDADGSLWHFLQLTLLLPSQAIGYVNLGAAYNQLEKYTQAVEVLVKAIKLSPSGVAYYNLGLAHRHLKNFPSAKTAFREALRQNPNLAEAHEYLANVYVELRDFTLAITHFQRALELRPDSRKALDGLNKATQALSNQSVDQSASAFAVAKIGPDLSAKTSSQPIDSMQARYLGRDISRAANDLRQHFENTIIPLLTHMRRLVIEGRSHSDNFREQQLGYRAACQQNAELRRTLRMLCVRFFATDELSRPSRQ